MKIQRIFYIDVGQASPTKALELIKSYQVHLGDVLNDELYTNIFLATREGDSRVEFYDPRRD